MLAQIPLAGGELCAIFTGLLGERLEGPMDNKAVLTVWF